MSNVIDVGLGLVDLSIEVINLFLKFLHLFWMSSQNVEAVVERCACRLESRQQEPDQIELDLLYNIDSITNL